MANFFHLHVFLRDCAVEREGHLELNFEFMH